MAAQTGRSQGTWHPTSFHGHFRSKSRNDFVNEYRQQAKPTPPGQFVRRLTSRPTTHQFSHHDNRFSFLNTVTSFQDGLGKKKVDNSYKGKFIPDFIAWVPHRNEISQAGPMESVYNDTFRESDRPPNPQILVNTISKPRYVGDLNKSTPFMPFKDPATVTFDPAEKPFTTYQFTHRHMQPNRSIITNMNTGNVEMNSLPMQKTSLYINPQVPSIYDRPKSTLTRMRKARIASAPMFRSSVADCMKWCDADDADREKRPKTASGCFPAITAPDTQSSFVGSQFSQTVPTLSSKTSMDYNSNVGNQTAPSNQHEYTKTSRVPATQMVHTTETNFNPSSAAPMTDSQPILEQG